MYVCKTNMCVCMRNDQYGIFLGGGWKIYRTTEWISSVFKHIPMERRNTYILYLCVLSIHDHFYPLACFVLATNPK